MSLQGSNKPPLTALFYYQQAMVSLNEGDITTALNHIDIAISLATDKSLYVFYKIKILYLSQLPLECSNLILRHFYFLYIHCPLNQFAQILTYYEEATNCTTTDLSKTLDMHHIPHILAYIYPDLINDTDYNFHSRALDFKQRDEFEDCISCCHLALKFEPDSLSLLHLQAECYLLLSKYTESVILYDRIIVLSSLTTEIAYSLAKAYIHLERFNDAINYLKIFLLDHSNHIEGLTMLGECYIHLGNYPKALIPFKQLIKLEPKKVSYFIKLGDIYTLLRHKLLARRYYKYANCLQQHGDISSNKLGKLLKTKYWVVGILLLCITQFYLFRCGVLPSIIYALEVKVDKPIIPINGFTDYQVLYKQFPPYAKAPTYEVVSSNPKVANTIEGLSSLNGFSVGTATFDISLNSNRHTSFTIEVQDIVPTAITFELAHKPLIAGNKTHINWSISYENDLKGELIPTFTSTNPSILKVSPTGDMLEALAPGKATIIATCGELTTSLDIEVKIP